MAKFTEVHRRAYPVEMASAHNDLGRLIMTPHIIDES